MIARSNPPRPVTARPLRCAALLLGIALPATAALALPPPIPRDLPHLVVSFADLNLADARDVAVLYRRLEAAARKVCPLPDAEFLQAAAMAEDCRHRAMQRAAAAIDNSRLRALVYGRGGTG
jgi:UrcA family protein